MKNKKLLIKTSICCFLLLIGFGCRSNPREKIKLVLDNYDQINKDFNSSMRQIYKTNPGDDAFLKSFYAVKSRCDKVNKIDTSETPPDFRTALKKLNSIDCDNLNSPADLGTYEGDPKTKAFHNAERELEETAAKYGYVYKHSTSPK